MKNQDGSPSSLCVSAVALAKAGGAAGGRDEAISAKKRRQVKSHDIKKNIIRILKKNAAHFTSGEIMSTEFGISRAGLWKHIGQLRQQGYVIESFPRKGYRFKKAPDKLTSDGIREGLESRILGCGDIHCFDSITSTNEVACTIASDGAVEGTIVTAESQTKGRGRMRRVWVSPSGGGLYFSVILRPDIRIDEIPSVTLVVAASVARVISEISGTRARVKWPNDIFIGEKKVCGILAETRAHTDRTDFLVLGIGINVNTASEQLPPEAASIKAVTGSTLDREKLLGSVLESIERSYLIFLEKGFRVFRDEMRELSNVIGKKVRIETREKAVSGKAIDIDERGALMVIDSEGNVHRIFSGDVVLPVEDKLKEAAEI